MHPSLCKTNTLPVPAGSPRTPDKERGVATPERRDVRDTGQRRKGEIAPYRRIQRQSV
jgi:hypothetical protein